MLNPIASALCLTLTMTFSVIFSHKITLAESVDINFSGVVEPRAGFDSYTPGKIESSISGKDAKNSNGFSRITPAKINLQTMVPTEVNVSSPQLISSSSDTRNVEGFAILRVDSSQVNGNNAILPAGKNTLEVDMSLKENQVFAPGTYNYGVTVTIVHP